MNDCCQCIDRIVRLILYKLEEFINSIICNIPNNTNSIKNIERMLAHNNPMTIAAEYPTIKEDRFVVSTDVRFLDMLNTDIYIIFKIDNNESNFPVYFKDSIDYEHRVVLGDKTPVLASDLQLNGIYKAKYQYTGGFIILDTLTPLNPDIINE